eukprot:m.23275 g.23275  ORF g.23275 m.23275 type:complete len:242 (-) comp11360_c0_seq1:1043-1768(-)
MSAKEEQKEELESLVAIFADEVEVLTEDPCNFNVFITSEESPDPDDENVQSKLTLNITYTETYPEEAPEWKLIEPVDVDDDIVQGCTPFIEETIEENMGMAMVFAIVNVVKEHLDDANAKRRDEIVEQREAAKEEEQRLEMERLTAGTLLTPETFHEWNTAFIAEQRIIQAQERAAKTAASKDLKLTGKELFLKFAAENMAAGDDEEGGPEPVAAEGIAIDQGMFAGLEDIDFDALAEEAG